jgi:hypothetical protein
MISNFHGAQLSKATISHFDQFTHHVIDHYCYRGIALGGGEVNLAPFYFWLMSFEMNLFQGQHEEKHQEVKNEKKRQRATRFL